MSLALIFALSACSSDNSSSASDGKKETIGIIQFGSHGSLNNCYDGVIAGLKEAGIDDTKYNIELLNSNFDAGVSQTQANNLVNKKAKDNNRHCHPVGNMPQPTPLPTAILRSSTAPSPTRR